MPRDTLPTGSSNGVTEATILRLEADAAELTRRALVEECGTLARRAIAAREEAALARRVAGWKPPTLDRDAGPTRAAGRGALVAADIGVMAWSDGVGAMVPDVERVARRDVSRTINAMDAADRNTAEIYAALVEQRGAVRGVDLLSGGGGGGDGMAALRRAMGQVGLAKAEAAIGDGLAIRTMRWARPDQPVRRAIPVRVLVDAVCLESRTISHLLSRYGWGRNASAAGRLSDALSAALRRMAVFIG